jgi:dTDP-4-amino-4,6-dideoxygalactose transaminase
MATTQPVSQDQTHVGAAPSLSTKQPPLQFLDLKAQFSSIREEVMQAVESVFESQHFILGKEVQLLEQEIAKYVGVRAGVGCASGSDALYLALLALHIGRGDEVITTPFTFVATAGAIARTGAKPVFVDIDPVTFNIDTKLIEAAVTERTRAIMPVHLFGLSADLDPILNISSKHNLAIVEDAAQAIGATYNGKQVGSFGLCGCFSFFPSKNLGCAGDGGMITLNDAKIEDELRLLRAHGSRKKYQYEILGTNSRLDALHAAILRVKLRHLDAWASKRCQHADLYRQLFAEYKVTSVTLPSSPENCTHVYNQFVIRVPDRDQLRGHLEAQGIPTDVYYPSPLHVQQAFSYLGYSKGDFPESEKASSEVLALPVYPELSEANQDRIVRAIGDFYTSKQ